ncbi:MAG: hypothetical protein WBV21_05510, partial [Desulfobacterales bacterium]
GVPSALLERRPDLVAAERQVLAAFRLREAAELALLPSFALTLEGGRVSDGLLSCSTTIPGPCTVLPAWKCPIIRAAD